MQKCTHAYRGWSVFTGECTPAIASSAIKVIAFFVPKMERPIVSLYNTVLIPNESTKLYLRQSFLLLDLR